MYEESTIRPDVAELWRKDLEKLSPETRSFIEHAFVLLKEEIRIANGGSMKRTIEEAFNEWMRRYIETPEQFSQQFQQVIAFRDAVSNNATPTYGSDAAAYLQFLMDGN